MQKRKKEKNSFNMEKRIFYFIHRFPLKTAMILITIIIPSGNEKLCINTICSFNINFKTYTNYYLTKLKIDKDKVEKKNGNDNYFRYFKTTEITFLKVKPRNYAYFV